MKYLGNLGYEKGTISTSDFLSQVNSTLKTDLDLSEFTQLWNATLEEDQEMAELMEILARARPLYLLSNTNENHFEYLQNRYNIERHFTELILSYKVGHSKPEAEIYAEVFKRSGLQPAECLFIDDLKTNIEAAQDLGMKTILYTGAQALKQKLPDFGVGVGIKI
jgi:HAD superfamily hydrolase (TIGR01509 family)